MLTPETVQDSVKEAESGLTNLINELLSIWNQYNSNPEMYNRKRALEISEELEPWRDFLTGKIVDKSLATTCDIPQIMDIFKESLYNKQATHECAPQDSVSYKLDTIEKATTRAENCIKELEQIIELLQQIKYN